MTSGTDDPRPAGQPPADAESRPGSDPPAAGTPPPATATQPWRRADEDPAAADGAAPAGASPEHRRESEPIRPLPGGGWVYAPHNEARGGEQPRPPDPLPASAPAGSSGSTPGTPGATDATQRTPQVPSAQPQPASYGGSPTYGARPSQPATAARTTGGRPARKPPRRVRLTLRRIDPWSMLKFSFVYSLAAVIVLVVAAAVLYFIVDSMGVIDSIRTFLNDVEGGSSRLSRWLGFGRVMTIAIVVGAVNVVLFTAIATLTAFVYNVCTEIVGGIEVTFTDAPGVVPAEVASSGGRGL